MNTETSVEIDCPVDQVFEYTNNNVVEWSQTVVEDTVIEEKNGGGVGTTFRCVTEEKGNRMEFLGTVIEWDPPRRSTVLLKGKHFDIGAEYIFDDLGGRTRITQKSTVEGKGFFKVFFFLFGSFLKKSGCEAQTSELMNLKRILESRAANVQA